jgi:dipeptidyl aminopeptidase/acylaminoacyl peptidase
VWSANGKSILHLVGSEGKTNLGRFDVATGAFTELTKGNQAVLRFRATPDGRKVVCLISTPTRIGDLFVLGDGGEQRQLTDVNRELFSQLMLGEPEEITYTSFDGRKIQGWVQKPMDFDQHRKYPLILDIHGGPHAAYGYIFEHEFQWMATKGYCVFYPNPGAAPPMARSLATLSSIIIRATITRT